MFPIGEQPKFIRDLNEVDVKLNEIAIQGKTKNLERLKEFRNLEKVWLFTINQAQFDLILSFIRPRTLYIYEMRVENLASLEILSNTEQIYLCWNTKADKLWDLSKNFGLKSLSIEDFKKLNNIEPLQRNPSLENLEVSGGIWNSLTIDTLEPIRALTNLTSLSLLNIRVKDESLKALTHLKGLSELSISNQFPTEEYARLSVTLTGTKCDYFQPYVVLDDAIDGKDIMVIGKRKPFLNSHIDKKKLERYIAQFTSFQKKFIDLK
ncbi:MAG: leucine-rich repeat domain-containing protein [Bacillus sp. (in: firmicutes)]